MVKCEICGKELKSTQGLRGHKYFAHAENESNDSRSVGRPATQQALSVNSEAPAVTQNRLSKLEERLTRLEQATGVRDPSEVEKMLGINQQPLVERVAQQAKRLSELAEKLTGFVAQDASDAALVKVRQMLETLRDETTTAIGNLDRVIRDNTASCNVYFESIEEQIGTAKNQLSIQAQNVVKLRDLGLSDRIVIQQLNSSLKLLEQKTAKVEIDISQLKILIKRQPTGETVEIKLNDNRYHHFNQYKSPEGLTRPYRQSNDFVLGNRWVDLNEPQD